MPHRALFACAAALLVGCEKAPAMGPDAAPSAIALSTAGPPAATPSASVAASSGSASAAEGPVVDLVVGTGAEAKPGNKVSVHYTLWLASNGKRVESSYDKHKPYSFRLGAGAVIAGWDSGVEGMRVGGKRRLTVPPQLAYGGAGSPPSIPGNATLVFEITLVDVKP